MRWKFHLYTPPFWFINSKIAKIWSRDRFTANVIHSRLRVSIQWKILENFKLSCIFLWIHCWIVTVVEWHGTLLRDLKRGRAPYRGETLIWSCHKQLWNFVITFCNKVISHLVIVFLLLNLNIQLSAGTTAVPQSYLNFETSLTHFLIMRSII